MYQGIFYLHSIVRYFILIMLIVVIVQSLLGLVNKKPYGSLDNRLGLFLFILTHTQLLLGIILFFISPAVQFSSAAMKEASTRYWLVEHNTAMIIAIVLISVARISSKKLANDADKHRRMFILNTIALAIILVTIWLSGRGIISRA
jgi:Na+-translocating ferredoxin:NAD+ oxidoreductase RnfA subunit